MGSETLEISVTFPNPGGGCASSEFPLLSWPSSNNPNVFGAGRLKISPRLTYAASDPARETRLSVPESFPMASAKAAEIPSRPLLAPLNVQVLSFRTVCKKSAPRPSRREGEGF